MSLPGPTIDVRYEPLIVTTMPERFTDDELTAFLAEHERLLAKNRRHCTITDLSRIAGMPDARMRKRIADWNQRMEPAMRRWTVGTAIVAPSPLLRGAMTALNWLSPPPYPQEIVGSRAEARAALERMYARSGEPVPATLAAFDRETRERRAQGATE